MIFAFIFGVLIIAASWVLNGIKADDEARSDRKIDEAVEKRDITKQDLQNVALTKERKKYAKKQIVEAAKTDAQQKNAQYKNYFSQDEHSEIYRNAYRRLRKNYIEEQAQSDVKNRNPRIIPYKEPAEQKIYQEAYVKFKAEADRREVLSAWTDEEQNLPVKNEEFVEMFVENTQEQRSKNYKQ